MLTRRDAVVGIRSASSHVMMETEAVLIRFCLAPPKSDAAQMYFVIIDFTCLHDRKTFRQNTRGCELDRIAECSTIVPASLLQKDLTSFKKMSDGHGVWDE